MNKINGDEKTLLLLFRDDLSQLNIPLNSELLTCNSRRFLRNEEFRVVLLLNPQKHAKI